MKKRIFILMLLIFSGVTFSQINVDQTKTPAQLVIDDLIGNGVTVSNITFNGSAANANVLRDQASLFTSGANTPVGIERGVLLTTGNGSVAEIGSGQIGSASQSSSTAQSGDADLALLVTSSVMNAAVLEFDFVPNSSTIEFRYVFASEEYPEFACGSFNDVFGFFLSGPGISGPFSNSAANIALIPGTTTPVSINTINDDTCSSHSQYYQSNDAFIDPVTGLVNPNTVQYDGMTTILTARADVQCGQTYHIKLAIANVTDNNWDSAVFLEANSFSTFDVDLGPDRDICGSTEVTLTASFGNASLPSTFSPEYNWYLDNVLQTTTTVPTLVVNQSGTWRVDVITPGCNVVSASDEVEVQFVGSVPFNYVDPVEYCNETIDLTSFESDIVAPEDPSSYTFVYYDENGVVIPDPTVFNPSGYALVEVKVSTGPCFIVDVMEFYEVCPTCTIDLSSAIGTDDQTICIGGAIDNIEYITGADVTNAMVTNVADLPAGLTTSYDATTHIFTISGIPTEIGEFNYTITTQGCATDVTIEGTITIKSVNNAGTLSGNQAICIGGTTTFTSDGDANGTWSSDNTAVATVDASGVITGVGAGTATITYLISGTGSCPEDDTTLTVTVTTPPNAGVLSGVQDICLSGTTTFASDGDATGTWSSDDTAVATVDGSGVITGTGVGTATITYTVLGTGGCTDATATLDVTVTTPPNAGTLSGNQAICIGSTTTFTSDGDAIGTWSSDDTAVATVDASGVVTGVGAGTATITYLVTGGVCPNDDTTLTVTVTTPPNAGVLSGVQDICLAGTTTFASDGDATGTWSSDDTAVATVDGSGVITGIGAGTATITYTVLGTGGCTDATATLDVTVVSPPNAGALSGNQAICIGGTTTFTSDGDTGGTWSSDNTAVATVDVSGVITGVGAGTTTITYLVTGGVCPNDDTTLTVTVTSPPNAGDLSGNPAICIGGTTTFTSDGDTGGTWSSDNTAVATVDVSGVITGVGAGTATITYTVLGTGGCTDATATLDVTVISPPNAGDLSGNPAICIGGTTTFTSDGDTGGTWSSDNTAVATVDVSGVITGVGAGTATITYLVTGGVCPNDDTTLTVTVTTPPNAGVLSGVQGICVGDATTFASNGDTGGTWSSDNTAVATVDVSGVITGVGAGTANITYTVLGTGGCANATTTLDVTVLVTPNAGTLSGVQDVCVGNTTVFTSDGDTGGTWSSDNTAVATVDASGVVTGVGLGTAIITYEKEGSGSCPGDSATLTVSVNAKPIITVIEELTICNGSTLTQTDIGLTSTESGTTYTWTSQAIDVSGAVSQNPTSVSDFSDQILTLIGDNTSGQVVYLITPYANGCEGDAKQVKVNVVKSPTVSMGSTTTTLCEGEMSDVTFSGTPNAVVTYTLNGATQTLQLDANGDYVLSTGALESDVTYELVSVSLETAPYCTQMVSGTVSIEVKPIPNDIPSTTEMMCSGENTNIHISTIGMAGYTIEWTVNAAGVDLGASNGSGTADGVNDFVISQTLSSSSTEVETVVYTITVISDSGCKGNPFTATLNVNPRPQPELVGGSICVDATGTIFQGYVLDAGDYTGNFNFQWYHNGNLVSGAVGATYEVAAAGDYYVVVTDNNYATNCSNSSNIVTVEEINPATGIDYTVTDAFSDNATVVISITGGNGEYQYQMDDDMFQDSNVFTGVSGGVHTVTVVDTKGCTYLTLEVLVIDYPNYFTPNGDGYNDTWNIVGLENQPSSQIHIFDRYGKLIKQISPSGLGWDGTYNGNQMPSTDYWFTVEYDENGQQKVFKAHFSLKR